MFAPLLEVQIPKKCTLLWREAHLEVKMYKTLYRGSDHFWRFRCRFASLRVITLHYTLHYTTVHYTTLHSTTLQLQLQNYTTTLHYTPLHYINYNTLRHITLHSTTLHHITLHYTLHYTTLHYTTLYTPHTTVHYTTLHNTTTTTTELHNYTPLHSTTHRYTKLRPAISFEECKQRCFARPNHLGQDLKLWRSVHQRIQKFLHVWHGSKGPFLFSIEWLFTQVQHPMVLWGAPPKIGTSTMRIFA